jgi:hypothetical protein
VSVRDVLTSGEVSSGNGRVLYGLQDLLWLGVGDVHQDKGWSMAGDDRWWQPWRCTHVPGKGPVNRDGGGAHELRGSAGMRFPYPIWLETGRKVVVDGEVDLRHLRRAAARGRVDSGQGMPEARSEWVGRLVGRERKLLGARIWEGWSGRGEFRRAAGGRLGVREEEERENSRKEGLGSAL